MTDTPETIAIRAYLARLERGLRPLPKDDRAQILNEIQSHITDSCIASGTPAVEVLEHLGDPDELARSYVEQYRLADALAGPARVSLLLLILERASRSIVALATGLGGALLYVFSLTFVLIAVLKPVLPQNVGLWWGPGAHALGIIYGIPQDARELLGYWIVPLGVIGAILCYIAGTALMHIGGRRILRRGALRLR